MIQKKSIRVVNNNGNPVDLSVSVYECSLVDCRLGRGGFALTIEEAKVFVENLTWAINEAYKYYDQ